MESDRVTESDGDFMRVNLMTSSISTSSVACFIVALSKVSSTKDSSDSLYVTVFEIESDRVTESDVDFIRVNLMVSSISTSSVAGCIVVLIIVSSTTTSSDSL